ncbi:MAG: recombinase family protein, partial [Clostridia bacterium]|nr:recombinase family protein [Clostridia bacterium]
TFKQAIAPYGYRKDDIGFQIVPEEAEVVKDIFGMVLSGYGIGTIADDLNQRGIPGPKGTPWLPTTVRDITRNPAYIGDQLYQKNYVDDNFKLERNKGELDQYRDEGHHEAIVDRETFELAEKNVQQRGLEKKVHRKRMQYALSGRLVCGHCGRTMKRAGRKGYYVYECCGCGSEPEENVKNAFCTCLNKLAFSQKQHPSRRILDVYIGEIGEVEQQGIADRLREIDSELQENQMQADVLTAIALVNHFTPEEHSKKMRLMKKNEELRREKVMISTCATNTVKAEKLKEFAAHWSGGKFPEKVFPELVESATVIPGESVTFHFACGLELKESLKAEEGAA